MRSGSSGCISDDLAVLRAEASADPGRRTDLLWLRGVKYTFVTAIEAGVDVAQHVCASQEWGPPRDNGDAIRLLGFHGVLSAANWECRNSGGLLEPDARPAAAAT